MRSDHRIFRKLVLFALTTSIFSLWTAAATAKEGETWELGTGDKKYDVEDMQDLFTLMRKHDRIPRIASSFDKMDAHVQNIPYSALTQTKDYSYYDISTDDLISATADDDVYIMKGFIFYLFMEIHQVNQIYHLPLVVLAPRLFLATHLPLSIHIDDVLSDISGGIEENVDTDVGPREIAVASMPNWDNESLVYRIYLFFLWLVFPKIWMRSVGDSIFHGGLPEELSFFTGLTFWSTVAIVAICRVRKAMISKRRRKCPTVSTVMTKLVAFVLYEWCVEIVNIVVGIGISIVWFSMQSFLPYIAFDLAVVYWIYVSTIFSAMVSAAIFS
eukprot:g492.t1